MQGNYDFGGWATKNDLLCADGRIIRRDAFKDCDGSIVPLVWNHDHNSARNVLGHALLQNRPEGVYAYCSFNDTEDGQTAKALVNHGDIDSLSIYANKLKHDGANVLHGAIREVSLVLAGANPGAHIDSITMAHGESSDEEAVIFTGEELEHSQTDDPEDEEDLDDENEDTEDSEEEPEDEKDLDDEESEESEEIEHSEKTEDTKMAEKTVQDVIDSMTEEQKNVMYALVGAAAEGKGGDEEDDMKHNLFENEYEDETLQHSEEIMAAIQDGKHYGSLRDSFLEHGITNIEYLFPDARNLTDKPGFINTTPIAWVDEIMKGVHHTPFSRIKMMFADITVDEARAKGYIKGNVKLEEQFGLLKRIVTPTTVYKKQKLDRDDVVDITDFDVVAWLKAEMRMKLDEELARAFLFGDGRSAASEDKISEANIIPAIKDTTNGLYAMEVTVTPAAGEALEHALIKASVKAMDQYEGSGNLTAFLKTGLVSDMLLMEDTLGHRLYKNIQDLALAMDVNKIVKVPASIVPAGFYGIALDLGDYNVGADKGGAINMFDDFDIDYNAQKYLIETRCSGALTKPHSAIVFKAAE